MNRSKVINDCMSFKEFRKMKAGIKINPKQQLQEASDTITLNSIEKVFKDKKNIPSDRRRKNITRDLFIEYLDTNYNVDFDF